MNNIKHYTECIPFSLAEKLEKKGMPLRIHTEVFRKGTYSCTFYTTYADVFDWLMEKGVSMDISSRPFFIVWDNKGEEPSIYKRGTWHEAAEAAIEKALTLI